MAWTTGAVLLRLLASTKTGTVTATTNAAGVSSAAATTARVQDLMIQTTVVKLVRQSFKIK